MLFTFEEVDNHAVQSRFRINGGVGFDANILDQ